MKRIYKPDPVPLRRKEYEKDDGDLLAALVETIEANAGVLTIPASMAAIIEKRNTVKERFKK